MGHVHGTGKHTPGITSGINNYAILDKTQFTFVFTSSSQQYMYNAVSINVYTITWWNVCLRVSLLGVSRLSSRSL